MRTLDRILDAGFTNYHLVRRSHGLPDGSYLETGHLDNPQHAIRLTAGNVLVTIDPWSFSGNYGAPIDDGERVCSTVCVGLHRMLELYDRGIVFIANQWMAVFRVGAEYFIFNPPVRPRGARTPEHSVPRPSEKLPRSCVAQQQKAGTETLLSMASEFRKTTTATRLVVKKF